MFKVYKVTNMINGKIYIGQTRRSLFDRMASHRDLKRGPMYMDIRTHGIDSFKCELLDLCKSRHKALEKELNYILLLKSNDPKIGYNIMDGNRHASVTKEKIKKTLKARVPTLEQLMHIQLMGLARKGLKVSDETRKKLSESHSGQTAWNKGKKLSKDHVNNLKKALTGRKLSDEHKEAIRRGHTEK
jgi:group I intron endonuclease